MYQTSARFNSMFSQQVASPEGRSENEITKKNREIKE
jgi:hypothetical protein